MENEKKRLGIREWISIILIGFAGQLAWAIENNYINMWVYSQTGNAEYITWMTMASAVAAAITTFFMGALSDRLGSRKYFIAGGYTIWGVSVFAFALISRQNISLSSVFAGSISLWVGIWMVVVDCMMTFFGSTANDACFNAHVTDVTNKHNRGKVESFLSILPLFATVVVLLVQGVCGAGSTLTDAQKEAIVAAGQAVDVNSISLEVSAAYLAKPWMIFFGIFGGLITLIGVVSFFIIPKESLVPNKERGYMASVVYGFRPKVIKANPNFYIACLAFMAFNMAMDSFMPYFMVYFQNPIEADGLGLAGMNFYLIVGVIIVLASAIVVVIGLFMDKIGKRKLLIPAMIVTCGSLLVMFFANPNFLTGMGMKVLMGVGGILMMGGYLVGTAVLGAMLRDETPEGKAGLFQGVRIIMTVMIPMIVGSYASSKLMQTFGGTYINEFGETAVRPNNVMFLVALGFLLLAIIPCVWLVIRKKKEEKSAKEEKELQ